jgi:HlyD family secretion protein
MKKLLFIPLLALAFIACSENGKNYLTEESGTIEARDVVLSSQTAGKIIKLNFDEGAPVKKGDTLIVIDHEQYELQLKQAIASRDVAKAQLDLLVKGSRKEDVAQAGELFSQAESNLKLAEIDKQRMENLYNSNAVSKKQLDDAALKLDLIKSQYNAAKENLAKIKNIARPEEIAQAKANLLKLDAGSDLLRKNIRDCFVISPIDGVIIKRFIEEGETVSMMSSLLKVTNLSRVEVVVYVSEKVLPQIKLNQTADISTDGQPGKIFEGRVIFISPEAEFTPKNIQTKEERTKQVFAVKLEIENKTGELKTGLPVDVKIKL